MPIEKFRVLPDDPSGTLQMWSRQLEYLFDNLDGSNVSGYNDLQNSQTLLKNVVADERLGAQICGFARNTVAYKQDGTQILANLPRYEYARQTTPTWSDTFDVDTLSLEYTSFNSPINSISGGVLTSTGPGVNAGLVKKNLTLSDCEIEVICDTASHGGIVARYQDANNFYIVLIQDDSGVRPGSNVEVWKVVNGTMTNIIGYPTAVADLTWPRGTSATIKVAFNGTRIEVYFNGTKVISVIDTSLTSGQVGLYSYSGTQRYLDLKIYQASQAITIEEGTTNLVVQQDLTLWGKSGVEVTVTSGQTDPLGGTTAYKAVTTIPSQNGGVVNHGIYFSLGDLPDGATDAGSFWIKADANTDVEIGINTWEGETNPHFTATTQWQRLTFAEIAAVGTNYFAVKLMSTIPVYLWRPQVEQKAYATSWQIPGTARNAEILAIPTSGVFTKSSWAVELTFNPTSAQNVQNNYLWFCYIDANNYYFIITLNTGRIRGGVVSLGVAYVIDDVTVLQIGTQNSIMVAGDGNFLTLTVNGIQIGSALNYVEPVGTLPVDMYIGSDQSGANQCNGLIDDLRFSSGGRSLRLYNNATYDDSSALTVDEITTLKMDFDNTLRPTVRSRTREEDIPLGSDKLVTIIDDRSTDLVYYPVASTVGSGATSTNPWYKWYGSMYYYDKTYTVTDGSFTAYPASTQTVSYTFTGDKISVIGGSWSDSGMINVYLDNVLQATVDTNAPFGVAGDWNFGRAELYKIENIPYREHTIKLQATTSKNATATGYKFYFDGFRVGKGMNYKQTDEMVADQYVYIPTNANGYGALNVGGYEPGGQTGDWLMRCITGAHLYGAPDPTTNSASKPKVGVTGQWLYVWDGPASSAGVQVEYSALLIRK